MSKIGPIMPDITPHATAGQRERYRDNVLAALKPGGGLIIATFAPEAPPKCSGLPVERYTPAALADVLGPQFELKRHDKALHVTPGGVEQMYLYCHFVKTDDLHPALGPRRRGRPNQPIAQRRTAGRGAHSTQ